jgi:tetratricopeptide (TPR) repeat protein
LVRWDAQYFVPDVGANLCVHSIKILFFLCFLAGLLFFFNFSALAGQSHTEIPLAVQKTLYAAQKAIEQKDYAQARELLLDYVQKYPQKPHAMIYYLLGNAWYLSHDLQKAYHAYKTGMSLDANYLPLCHNLAQVAYELGKYREAGKFFEQAYACASQAKKTDRELLYNAALAWYQAGAYHKALQVLERLITWPADKIQKDWIELDVYVLLELKKFQKAREIISNYLAHDPALSKFWKLLAHIAIQQEDYAQAVSALEIAYKLKPPTPEEWQELARIYFYLNIPLKAAKALEKAYGPDPNPKECDELARGFAQANRLDKAIYYLDLALQKEPTSKRYLEKGQIYYSHGQWVEAARAYENALHLDQKNGLAYFMLGLCAMEMEDFSQAQKAFSQAARYSKYKDQAEAFLAALKDLGMGEENF